MLEWARLRVLPVLVHWPANPSHSLFPVVRAWVMWERMTIYKKKLKSLLRPHLCVPALVHMWVARLLVAHKQLIVSLLAKTNYHRFENAVLSWRLVEVLCGLNALFVCEEFCNCFSLRVCEWFCILHMCLCAANRWAASTLSVVRMCSYIKSAK